MKGKRGRISLILGLVCLVSTLFVSALEVLPLVGIQSRVLDWSVSFLNRFFSFTMVPSSFSLVPLAVVLGLWTLMIFTFRKRNRFLYVLVPLTGSMAYTLYVLSHLMQGSSRPLLISTPLPEDLRAASFHVVLIFLVEMALFVILTLIGDGMKHFRDAKGDRLSPKHDLPAKQERKQRKQRSNSIEKKKQQELIQDEEETITLNKKPVEAEEVIEGKRFVDQQVAFPPIAEVPALESLSRKHKPIDRQAKEDTIAVKEMQVGKISIGALHTLGEERKRNNGMSYLERKQKELEEQKQEKERQEQAEKESKKEPVQLSGFLQGALEAVGKAPKKHGARRKEPQGKVKSMLAQAVEEQQGKVETPAITPSQGMNIRERVLSVQFEPNQKDNQKDKEIQDPFSQSSVAKADAPIQQTQEPRVASADTSSFFAPKSTAQPAHGGVLEEELVQEAPQAKEEDPLESASGVGGLSSRGEASALINRKRITYQYPDESILVTYPQIGDVVDEQTVHQGKLLVSTLEQFNINAELTNIVRGPTVTMFELLPAPGVRVNSIVNLSDNIALALAATQVRIVAPIPGKSAVGVEIPNLKRDIIGFREMLPSLASSFGIPMVLGRSLMGTPIVIDVIKAPHLLIAGSTGSGKSVCVNSLICSVLFKRSPKQVRMILVDPKIVELNIYNGIPHLLTPVITDAKKTLKALDFCLYEMDRRYKLLQALSVRNIIGYNEKIESSRLAREKLPYLLVVIDEFADLMHLVGKDMESKVSRLAAMSRAVGIHLVLATQRPSVDVITGVIKNNIPTRIAFAVTSTTDSRIILDEPGADKLLGKGDMLYMSSSSPATERIQGAFLSDAEVEQVVAFVSSQGEPEYIDESFFEDDEPKASESSDDEGTESNSDEELMDKALAIVVERKCASASYLQRRLKIGYNRAARLVEQMEEMGYVGPPNGSKPRELIKYP
ncbi:MAG: DNA translocase FtsK [Sphaerochaetaceae bacterium]